MSPASPSPGKQVALRQLRHHRQSSPLRVIRLQRGLTQQQLADLAGMHRNSIRKIENGVTRGVNVEHAAALAGALEVTVPELGLQVRAAVEAPSIKVRKLTPEQREILNEVLALPPADYLLLREAMEHLRESKRAGRRRRKGNR